MPSFQYTGYSRADGKPRRGVIEASGEKQAARALLDAGVFADVIRPIETKGGFGAEARSSFYRELGALLGAGLPLDRALAMMKDSPDKNLSAAIAKILDKIREGATLADAVAPAAHEAKTANAAAEYERAAILSGERSASLPAMLPKLSELIDAGIDVRDRVRSALVYPAFVLTLGLVVGVVMLGFVAPRTMRMMTAAGMQLPAASLAIIAGAKIAAFALLTLALVSVTAFTITKRRAPEKLDRFLLLAPLMGQARKLATLRFAWILAVLAEAGTALVEALPIAGAGSGRPWLRAHTATQTERVRNGVHLSEAVGAIPVVGPELFEWVRAGEAGGCLPRMLEVACERLRRQWRLELDRKMALLEPVILSLVGIFVLLTALAMILPVLGMTSSM